MTPFYTDPIKAAWMAKKFGMEFLNENGDELWIVNGGIFTKNLHKYFGICLVDYSGPYHIHPSSLALLEPMVGDLVYDGNTGYELLYNNSYLKTHKADRIILRDNRVFFAPEV